MDLNRIPQYKQAVRAEIRRALEQSGRETLRRVDRGFDTGQDAMGKPWTPLAPATIRRKGHGTILVDSGDLRDSFTWGIRGTPGRGADYELEIRSDDPKLSYHEFGTESIPKRPVLEPAARYLERNAIPDNIADALIDAEQRAGVNGRPI